VVSHDIRGKPAGAALIDLKQLADRVPTFDPIGAFAWGD
jgi:hypothetical protein